MTVNELEKEKKRSLHVNVEWGLALLETQIKEVTSCCLLKKKNGVWQERK